jgi:hypothetical protein
MSEEGTRALVTGLSQMLDAMYYLIDEEDVEVQKVGLAQQFLLSASGHTACIWLLHLLLFHLHSS